MRRSFLLFGSDNCPTENFAAFMHDVQVPGDDLPSIDEALQKRFFQKGPDGQPLERWELKAVEVSCSPDQFKQHLAACGFLNETKPSEERYEYAAWPGALVTRAVARLNDLITASKENVWWPNTIVFGGKRPLQPDKENFEECCKVLGIEGAELEAARNWWEKSNPQTELQMMKWVWEIGDHPLYQRTYFIDTPMKPPATEGGSPIRPSTEDTVQEWLKRNPTPGSVLLSSGAPYGMAQDEALWMLLEPYGFTVETFGHAAPGLPPENFMREVAGCVNRIRKARLSA